MKLTVTPAMTPAIAWPRVGNLLAAYSPAAAARPTGDEESATMEGLEKKFSYSIRR